MLRFVGRRVIHLFTVLLMVSLGVSLLINLAPGDPAYLIAGEYATPDQVRIVHQQMGLDKPFFVRWASWVSHAAHGDLGVSYSTKQPVWQAIHQRLPVTAELAVLVVLVSLFISVPVGVLTAYRQGTAVDRGAAGVSSGLLSSPGFLTALVLVFVFAVTWRIFPVTGWVPLTKSVPGNLRHVILPVASLAALEGAVLSRLLRSDMITTLQEDFIFAARAKGLPMRQVLFRHALRPSSFSLVTVAGLSLGRILGGTIIVEQLFALPGLGVYVVQAITTKDLIAVQGAVLFLATAYVVVNALVELSYAWLDPRIRTASRAS